jgi:hypothetical protein
VAQTPQPSAAELHKQWVKLENEQHQLAAAIERAKLDGRDPEPLRQQQAKMLLKINTLVNAIQHAPDVALEHELDLASDIAFYGLGDYPMTARLLRELAQRAPGFEFNSLRRWLSSSQFQELTGNAMQRRSS